MVSSRIDFWPSDRSSALELFKSAKFDVLGSSSSSREYLSKNTIPSSVILYRSLTPEYSINPLSTAMARYLVSCECDTAALFIIVVLYSHFPTAERNMDAMISISERFFIFLHAPILICRFFIFLFLFRRNNKRSGEKP
jgi:hypothetical protein